MYKFLILAFILTACGDDSGSKSKSDETAPYQGVWVSDCTYLGDDFYSITTVTVSGNEKTTKALFYLDEQCEAATQETISVMTFEVVGNYDLIDGVQLVDSVEVSYTMAILDEELVETANTDKVWGYSNWKAGVHKDLAGRRYDDESDPEPKAGTKYYSINKIDLEATPPTWTTGDTSGTTDGTTEAKRPTSLNTEVVLKKQ